MKKFIILCILLSSATLLHAEPKAVTEERKKGQKELADYIAVENAKNARELKYQNSIKECGEDFDCKSKASGVRFHDMLSWTASEAAVNATELDNLRRAMYNAQRAYGRNPSYENYAASLQATQAYINFKASHCPDC